MGTFVAVSGGERLWMEDSGDVGPAAVLLHPGIADARSWDLIWPLLAGRVRAIRYDARGYGRSPGPAGQFRHLDDLIAVLDACGLASAHLVGCSMGGANAIDLALASPERVESLTLLCPGLTGYQWPEEADDAEAEAAIAAGDDDALLALALRAWAAAGTEPLVTDMMRSAMRAWPGEAKYAVDPEPAVGRLGQVTTRAVLMVGDRDRPSLIQCNEMIAAGIPGCELIRMPGVDHLPAVREPAQVAGVILRQCGLAA
jgi:3-oxoadipate enol-lactonase